MRAALERLSDSELVPVFAMLKAIDDNHSRTLKRASLKWDKVPRKRGASYVSPSDFIALNYRELYDAGQLSEDDLAEWDPDLWRAYKARIYVHPKERLPLLNARRTELEREAIALAPHIPRDQIVRWGTAFNAQDRRRNKIR